MLPSIRFFFARFPGAPANSVSALWNFTMYGTPMQWGAEYGMNLH